MRFLIVFLVLFLAAGARADDDLACLKQTTKFEKKEKIQTNLLTAIALVESGRYSEEHKTGIAWPWTVGAKNKGAFFNSKQEAIDAVSALRKEGVENIDVGCMQINLKYHAGAFETLQDAFDPEKNVAYAAKYLKKLYAETGSWGAAATRYHSKSARYAFRYEDKLLDIWKRLTEYGNPAAPVTRAEQIRALTKKNKEFFTLPRRPLTQTDHKKIIQPGSAESKKIADEWRKEKLEKYRNEKKTPDENYTKK